MADSIKAGYFDVIWDTPHDKIAGLCKSRADGGKKKNATPFEVAVGSHTYRLSDATWDDRRGIFSGTMYLKREQQLPSRVTPDGEEPLDLADHDDLGEPASFAYWPKKERALVEYRHTGPRHSVVQAFLVRMGIQDVIHMQPTPTSDALKQMQDAKLMRKLQFTFDNTMNPDALIDNTGTTGRAIDLMQGLDGFSIKVEVSMGHNEGSLVKSVKGLIAKLMGVDGVKTLKAGVKHDDDSPVQLLDMLRARLTTELAVPTAGRQLDHARCRSLLAQALYDQARAQ